MEMPGANHGIPTRDQQGSRGKVSSGESGRQRGQQQPRTPALLGLCTTPPRGPFLTQRLGSCQEVSSSSSGARTSRWPQLRTAGQLVGQAHPNPGAGPGRKRRRLESPVRNNFRGALLPLNSPALKGFINQVVLPGLAASQPNRRQHGVQPSQHSQPQQRLHEATGT